MNLFVPVSNPLEFQWSAEYFLFEQALRSGGQGWGKKCSFAYSFIQNKVYKMGCLFFVIRFNCSPPQVKSSFILMFAILQVADFTALSLPYSGNASDCVQCQSSFVAVLCLSSGIVWVPDVYISYYLTRLFVSLPELFEQDLRFSIERLFLSVLLQV